MSTEITEKSRHVVLTGDRPTGALHLGHLAGSLQRRVEIQETADQFLLVADLQALTDNAGNPAKVRDAVPEVVADYLAAGIDPEKTAIFLQSAVPELSELAMLYLNLVTVSRLERNPTVREEIRQRNFERDIPAGFLCYPAAQAADITAFKANIVPVGDDQLPMIELAQEVAARVNRCAGIQLMPRPEALLSKVTRLPGIDGKAKASKSLDNAIFLKDTADDVKAKVRRMYTDPCHLRVEDPGKIEGNVVFSYLDAFDPDQDAVCELKDQYRAGGLGDSVLKKRLVDVLDTVLMPMRARRRDITPQDAAAVLRDGTERARKIAAETVDQVKDALGVPRL